MPVDTELPQQGGPQTRPNQPSEGVRWPSTPPSGEPIAPGPVPQTPESTGLPPGTHPMDQSAPDEWTLGHEKGAEPIEHGRKPFATPNAEAFGVFQRSASHWRGGVVAVNPNEGGTAQVVGRHPGRVALNLWVPSQLVVGGVLLTPPNGVLFAATEGELQGLFGGTILNVGDSARIESEASVHIGLIPGAAVGYVQWMEFFNPPGGGITGNT